MKRLATIKTSTKCIFAIMHKKDYRNILEKIDMAKNELLVKFFR